MASPNGEAYERRREQVRRAQKSHRARKATYVKSLESEVSELRRENATQAALIRTLRDSLITNGIPIPAESHVPVATIEVGNRRLLYQEISARFKADDSSPDPNRAFAFPHTPPQAPPSQSSFGGDTSHSDSDFLTPPTSICAPLERVSSATSSASIPGPSFGLASGLASAPSLLQNTTETTTTTTTPGTTIYAHPQGLDATQVGVNFVLSLESPCLYHHRLIMPEMLLLSGQIGNGHRQMLSAPIMARAPEYSFNPLHLGMPSDARWDVPVRELENLLKGAGELGLAEGEITPVQGWMWLRRHPRFGRLGFEGLEEMRGGLVPLVECHGFGAVLDRGRFVEVVERVLAAV
ncbi:hypothetical protein EJ05DRAFT_390434 [Pseudovirgaria hyperparasitica]|uniref:BZIP domain-containing protein n=1 Tax=Pseudovirgaria hyperparasitica TaxID=470096 RepID=A0A6A6W4I4_9PEZI|nr:uncharacterized protein EJ05DRAFT_390434 [Pseudovirgaria hyperparasitica]KAF2757465.1 hypothetical protein EJ05DRAFT_390434 [Pseudovirgaria hyperparasitica]